MLPSNGRKVQQLYNYHMTLPEVRKLYRHVVKHCSMKYEIYTLLAMTRIMRPAEILAINKLDFKNYRQGDYSRLSYREAKSNKMRVDEYIHPLVAQKIRLYVETNNLKEGYLFPWYSSKGKHGKPYMDSKTMGAWFSKIRKQIGKEEPAFLDQYPCENGQMRYRIGLYSLRRFGETYLYNNNGYNIALIKEIMEYGKKFNPLDSYIKYFHKEDHKEGILEHTFGGLLSGLLKNQRKLTAFM